MVNIYTLSDPRTNVVRYVGKTTTDLSVRLAKHVYVNGNRHNDNWIKSLRLQGLRPKIELVDVVPNENWEDEEKFYISYFRFLGFDLTNLAEGGKGTYGLPNTKGQIAKCAKTKKERGIKHTITPEHRSKLLAGYRAKIERVGSCHTKEERARQNFGIANRKYDKKKIFSEKGMANLKQNNKDKRKPINQYSKEEILINTFPSLSSAADALGTSRSNIWACVSGRCKFAKGYIWKYANQNHLVN